MEQQTIKDIHIGLTMRKDPKLVFHSYESNMIYSMGRNQKGYIWMMEQDYDTKDHRFIKIKNDADKTFMNYFIEYMKLIDLPISIQILKTYSSRIKKFEYHLYGIKQVIQMPTLPLPPDHKWFGLDETFCMMLNQGFIYNPDTGGMMNDD